jgi:hypothetical protein
MGCGVGSKDVMSTVNPGVINNLVGGFNPSEKILVNWDYYSQHMEK